MTRTAAELQQLKGIGAVLANRLIDAGLDSFTRIAEAGNEGLKAIPGINPRATHAIVKQARQLAELEAPDTPDREEGMKQHLLEVRQKVEQLALSTRERFRHDLLGKRGKKLSADLIRVEDALTRMNGNGKKRRKRAERALTQVEKRLAGLNEASIRKVRKGVKRARKAALKAL